MTSLIEALARAIVLSEMPEASEEELTKYAPFEVPKAQAALSALQESGYVVVPREPTEAMKKAAPKLFDYDPHAHGTGRGAYYPCLGADAASIYRAMLSATEGGE